MASLHPAPITALSKLCPGAFCAPSSTAVSRCSSSSSLNSARTLRSRGSDGWSCFSSSDSRARIWLCMSGLHLKRDSEMTWYLLIVVLSDDCLHGLRTCHSRLSSHQSRSSAESQRHALPKRIQSRRPDIMLSTKQSHCVQVVSLVLPHLFHLLCCGCVPAEE